MYAPPTVGWSLLSHEVLCLNKGKGEELGSMTPLTASRSYSSYVLEGDADVQRAEASGFKPHSQAATDSGLKPNGH